MVDLSKDISDFIGKIYKTNYEKDGVLRKTKAITFHKKFNCFEITGTHEVEGDGSGHSGVHSYYVRYDDFLPIIRDLMNSNEADFSVKGIYTAFNNNWSHRETHSYTGEILSDIDEISITISEGNIKGRLKLNDMLFDKFSIGMYAKKELYSGKGEVSKMDARFDIENKILSEYFS